VCGAPVTRTVFFWCSEDFRTCCILRYLVALGSREINTEGRAKHRNTRGPLKERNRKYSVAFAVEFIFLRLCLAYWNGLKALPMKS